MRVGGFHFVAWCIALGVSASKHHSRPSFLSLGSHVAPSEIWPADDLTAFGSDLSPADFAGKPRAAIGIGSQKCATTLMWKILRLHPEVITKHKETRWFQKPSNSRCHLQTKGNLVPMKDWSSDEKEVWTYDLYIDKCFGGRKPNGTQVTWEFSPGYMRANKPAPHFLELVEDSVVLRFIAVLRDPVDRVISEYNMKRKNAFLGELRTPTKVLGAQLDGQVDEKVFAKRHRKKRRHALASNFTQEELQAKLLTDLGRRTPGDNFGKGEYIDELEQWLEHFPVETLLVVNMHALSDVETWRRIFRHVGVSDLPDGQIKVMIQEASSEYSIGQAAKFGEQGMPHLKISDEARSEILAHYEPYNTRLWEFFGGARWW